MRGGTTSTQHLLESPVVPSEPLAPPKPLFIEADGRARSRSAHNGSHPLEPLTRTTQTSTDHRPPSVDRL